MFGLRASDEVGREGLRCYKRAVDPDLVADPWQLFDSWFAEAVTARESNAEAFTLATVGLEGRPSARVVLYKGRSGPGLRFFTNTTSRKGRELERVPFAAAVFYWPGLHRQVRFEGSIERLGDAESDAYFASRARESQLGAWASPQSQPLDQAALARSVEAVRLRFEGQPVPRPPHWGGYRLTPTLIEFWLPHAHRLNERLEFRRDGGGWLRQALAP